MRPTAVGLAYFTWISRRWVLTLLLIFVATAMGMFALIPDTQIRASAAVVIGISGFVFCLCFALPMEDYGEGWLGGYPTQLLKLPVRTQELVFWPVAFGAASLIALWLTVATTAYVGFDVRVPVVLPTLTLVVWMASLQAAAWAPLVGPLPNTLALLIAIAAPEGLVLWLSAAAGWPDWLIAAILIAWFAFAARVAFESVAAARRGDTWQIDFPLAGAARSRLAPARFRSAAQAERWYLRRSPRHRRLTSEAVWNTGLLAFAVWMARLSAGSESPYPVLLGACLLLLLLAGAAALSVGRNELSPYVPLLPIRSDDLAAAYFWQIFLRSFGPPWSWTITLAGGVQLAFALANNRAAVDRGVSQFFDRFPGWAGAGVVAMAVVTVIGVGWKLGTDALIGALKGEHTVRQFLTVKAPPLLWNAVVLVTVYLLMDPSASPEGGWWLSALVVVAACLKALTVVRAFRAASRQGLLRGVLRADFVLMWLLFAASSLGLVALFYPKDGLPVPEGILLLEVAITLPLGRFALIPMMLEQSRSR